MAITMPPVTDDSGLGTDGTILTDALWDALGTAIDTEIAVRVAAAVVSGSWTPTIGGSGGQSGQAYSSQTGTYVKTGPLVHVQGGVTLSTLGTITGNVQIKGLPFAAIASVARAAVSIGYQASLTTSVVWLGGYIASGESAITLTMRTAAQASVAFLAQANLSATTDLVFSIDYMTT